MAQRFVVTGEAGGYWEEIPDAAPIVYGSLADVQANTNGGVYDHFGPSGNDWSVINGALFIFPGRGGNPPADVRGAYRLATVSEVSNAMDPNGIGNNEGGSDLQNILTGVGFVAAPWALAQLAPILGTTTAGAAVGAGKAVLTGGNPLLGAVTGGAFNELKDLISAPDWGDVDAGPGWYPENEAYFASPEFAEISAANAAAIDTANELAIDAANQAAIDAANQAAIDAANRAAIDAANAAADQAAHAMPLVNPWNAGTPGLLDQPSPVTSAAQNVLDLVAPSPSGIGLSGEPLPLGWQIALGVPGITAPVFPTVTVAAPAAPGAPDKAAPVVKAVAAGSGAGLFEKLLGTAATTAVGAVLSNEIAKAYSLGGAIRPTVQSTDAQQATDAGALGSGGGALLLALAGFFIYEMA